MVTIITYNIVITWNLICRIENYYVYSKPLHSNEDLEEIKVEKYDGHT